MERPENISYVPTPEAIRDKYQYFTEAKMPRLRAAGYERPFTELEDGVARYVRDFLSQTDPYRCGFMAFPAEIAATTFGAPGFDTPNLDALVLHLLPPNFDPGDFPVC